MVCTLGARLAPRPHSSRPEVFSDSTHPLGGVRNGCPLGPISDPMLESTHASKALVARPGVFSGSTHPLGGVHNGCPLGPINDPMLESTRESKGSGSPHGSRPLLFSGSTHPLGGMQPAQPSQVCCALGSISLCARTSRVRASSGSNKADALGFAPGWKGAGMT